MKMLFWPISKLVALNNYPVVWQSKRFTFVGFGVFAAIETLAIVACLYVYLVASGHQLNQVPVFTLPLGVVCVWLGARSFHWWALGAKFWRKPKKYLNETGFYLQGGLIGGMVAIAVLSQWSTVPLLVLADGLAWGVLLGQFIGRLGCYNYGCCFGKPTRLSLSVCYSHPASKVARWRNQWLHMRLHPTQLYMAGQNIIGFGVVLYVMQEPLAQGFIFFLVMLWEGIGRLMVEPLRADMSFTEGRNWRTVQVASGLAVCGALGIGWLNGLSVTAVAVVEFSDVVGASLSQFLNVPHLWWANTLALMAILFGYGLHGDQLGTFPKWKLVWADLRQGVIKNRNQSGKNTHV